jgi:hypothetical protein
MSKVRPPKVVSIALEVVEATLAETRPLFRPEAQQVYQELANRNRISTVARAPLHLLAAGIIPRSRPFPVV